MEPLHFPVIGVSAGLLTPGGEGWGVEGVEGGGGPVGVFSIEEEVDLQNRVKLLFPVKLRGFRSNAFDSWRLAICCHAGPAALR